ncbi:hypothetical protein Afil01_52090 [Actinorhabdospora filicis]|uniref:Excreted virulence factor EspC, type VII ESX diderm n=1 Tax=Actinorhabdospora filicis TaxID=1785913 RepID=A0A9W6SR93_9ACTN|nr:hypothetical protein [Actinorhabdospora filicis]GLZ80402.1 hypothetical protein Afil01_52090 [Actinorhabdospora filicis]
MAGDFKVESQAVRGEAARFRTAVTARFDKAAEAMSTAQVGNPEMYGPLLNAWGKPAELAESFAKVAEAMKSLASMAQAIPEALGRVADTYDEAEEAQKRKFRSHHGR